MRVRGKIRRLITYILIVAFLATSLPLVCLEKAEAGATVIESVTVDKQEVCVGEPFTVTAIATSQNKPLYKFFIGEKKADGGWSWTVIQNYSEKNTLTYAIGKTGSYLISVYVKDSASSNDPDTFKQCVITVTTDNAIYVQDTRTFTVTATDGSQIPQTVSYTEDGVTTTLYLKEVKGYTVTKTKQVPVYRTESKKFTKTITKKAIPKNNSQFPSTYQINEDGYSGTIPRTKIDWVVNSYYPKKSVTVTKTLTGTSYRDGSGNPPSTTSVTYTDSESGRTVTGSIPKSGSMVIKSRTYEYLNDSSGPCFGYFSNNSTYYCNDGTDWVKYYYYNPPRKPQSVYKQNPFRERVGTAASHPDDGWTVYQYGWWLNPNDPNKNKNNGTHTRNNPYYKQYPWYQTGSVRKLVWVKYYRTKAWNWSQKYSGTLTLPKTPKDYKGTATYSGTLSKQVVDHYETIPTEWRAEVVYEGYIRNYCKSISVDPTSFNIYKGHTQQLTVTALLRDGTTKDVTNEATYQPNTDAVTVNSTGEVRGNEVGHARILVTYDVASTYVDVNVLEPVVEKITVIPEGGNIIRRGGTTQVITTTIMSDVTIKNVTNEANYESSDPSIATVSDTGLVQGLDVGSVTITAEYDDKTATVKIEVDPKLYVYIRRLE